MCPAWDGCTPTVPFVEVSSGPKSYAEFFCKKQTTTSQKRRLKTWKLCSARFVHTTHSQLNLLLYVTFDTRIPTHKLVSSLQSQLDTSERGQWRGWKEERGKARGTKPESWKPFFPFFILGKSTGWKCTETEVKQRGNTRMREVRRMPTGQTNGENP